MFRIKIEVVKTNEFLQKNPRDSKKKKIEASAQTQIEEYYDRKKILNDLDQELKSKTMTGGEQIKKVGKKISNSSGPFSDAA